MFVRLSVLYRIFLCSSAQDFFTDFFVSMQYFCANEQDDSHTSLKAIYEFFLHLPFFATCLHVAPLGSSDFNENRQREEQIVPKGATEMSAQFCVRMRAVRFHSG